MTIDEIEKKIHMNDKAIIDSMSSLIFVLETLGFKVISDFSLDKNGRIDIGHVDWEKKC
jgi:hypothetical protein